MRVENAQQDLAGFPDGLKAGAHIPRTCQFHRQRAGQRAAGPELRAQTQGGGARFFQVQPRGQGRRAEEVRHLRLARQAPHTDNVVAVRFGHGQARDAPGQARVLGCGVFRVRRFPRRRQGLQGQVHGGLAAKGIAGDERRKGAPVVYGKAQAAVQGGRAVRGQQGGERAFSGHARGLKLQIAHADGQAPARGGVRARRRAIEKAGGGAQGMAVQRRPEVKIDSGLVGGWKRGLQRQGQLFAREGKGEIFQCVAARGEFGAVKAQVDIRLGEHAACRQREPQRRREQ